jgi:hypothetical protein
MACADLRPLELFGEVDRLRTEAGKVAPNMTELILV